MRAAILCCEDSPKWSPPTSTNDLWRNALLRPEDAFTLFRCCAANEFPDPATVREQFDVVIIGGSHYSAYEQLPWISRLQQLLPQYLAAGVRVVGCCFGHQLLSQALGGRVGKNPSGRFVLGVERIRLDEAAARAVGLDFRLALEQAAQEWRQQEGAQQGQLEAKAEESTADEQERRREQQQQQESGLELRLLESHGDQVLELPPGAQLLAWSDNARHEMWALPGGAALAFQFHPEMSPGLAYDKIWSALSCNGRLDGAEVATAAEQLQRGPAGVDSAAFLRALDAFVRSPLLSPAAAETAGTAAAAAAESAVASAAAGLHAAAGVRAALEERRADAAEVVRGHARAAAAAGLAASTAAPELLTSLNNEAAAAYGKAADAAEAAAAGTRVAAATQQQPLQAALASLTSLEQQLDRLAAVVGALEVEAEAVEAEVAAAAAEPQQQQGQSQVGTVSVEGAPA
ncbi:hypothetical protein HXX76_007484 [Chlamydomonas incerta]|uniref:Glutamine amidotransferase domain-containing protein n=1 Tax=Chlamydomonas incerta TaxID=51695 RepID=A0A835SWV7_CHLIN|nr:hypothetical protein HXX76_007484 [Chlamydomonas incerta]|eukprot:KAG2434588.1 hypothetical protein HXX76_007484 [Chlamydomonas incerta]